MPLTQLFDKTSKRALTEYRCLLYYRGAVPTKAGQAAIPQRIIQEEETRGFKVNGAYRRRLRYFVDGVVIGSEGFVRQHIDRLRQRGVYSQRSTSDQSPARSRTYPYGNNARRLSRFRR